jgi:hypothetical protein
MRCAPGAPCARPGRGNPSSRPFTHCGTAPLGDPPRPVVCGRTPARAANMAQGMARDSRRSVPAPTPPGPGPLPPLAPRQGANCAGPPRCARVHGGAAPSGPAPAGRGRAALSSPDPTSSATGRRPAGRLKLFLAQPCSEAPLAAWAGARRGPASSSGSPGARRGRGRWAGPGRGPAPAERGGSAALGTLLAGEASGAALQRRAWRREDCTAAGTTHLAHRLSGPPIPLPQRLVPFVAPRLRSSRLASPFFASVGAPRRKRRPSRIGPTAIRARRRRQRCGAPGPGPRLGPTKRLSGAGLTADGCTAAAPPRRARS